MPVFTSDFQNNQFISKSYAGELSAKDIKAAESFVTNVADEGIEFLSDQRFTHEQRVKEFKELLSNNFDMRTIARFSLGRYWRTATDAQKKEYLRLFKENILEIYSRRFSDYKDQKVEVRSARKEGKADVLVSSYVVSPDAPEVKVDWRVRQKNGQYKIIDIIVEGVSQALTHRSDYSSVIQRGGGDVEVLLAHLRK
ncbi:MAG: ABC transporter substrate-binding protein [Pseudomonadota bacterium]